jgi:REP element-mobilizing transposase RayT
MGRRPLKRHVQQELPKTGKRDKNGQFRGGPRKGAGRPKRKISEGRSSESHKVRPKLKASQPVHVVLRASSDVGSLRSVEGFAAVREARLSTLRLEDSFRIIHFSIQRNHIHLLVEAHDRKALWKGMQVFGISCAKQLNAAISALRGKRRRGRVFTDRYYARILTTPREVRNCLAYVLNNWRHHKLGSAEWMGQEWKKVDPFSSALAFDGWKERPEGKRFKIPPEYEGSWIWLPRTWLMTTGWRRYGLISIHEIPGGGDE